MPARFDFPREAQLVSPVAAISQTLSPLAAT